MRNRTKLALTIGFAGLAAGCMSDEYRRADGLTNVAGDAIAANTVMQMVDPWQYGVQDTKLLVPAERPSTTANGASATQTQTTTSSGN